MSHVDAARTITEALRSAVDTAATHLAAACEKGGRVSVAKMDERQSVLYDLASVASSVRRPRPTMATSGRSHILAWELCTEKQLPH